MPWTNPDGRTQAHMDAKIHGGGWNPHTHAT